MTMGPLVAVEFGGMGNAFYGYDERRVLALRHVSSCRHDRQRDQLSQTPPTNAVDAAPGRHQGLEQVGGNVRSDPEAGVRHHSERRSSARAGHVPRPAPVAPVLRLRQNLRPRTGPAPPAQPVQSPPADRSGTMHLRTASAWPRFMPHWLALRNLTVEDQSATRTVTSGSGPMTTTFDVEQGAARLEVSHTGRARAGGDRTATRHVFKFLQEDAHGTCGTQWRRSCRDKGHRDLQDRRVKAPCWRSTASCLPCSAHRRWIRGGQERNDEVSISWNSIYEALRSPGYDDLAEVLELPAFTSCATGRCAVRTH
jgi:hypothetical protein